MNKNRLENLTDGVFAIVMTLLVMDLKVPELDKVVIASNEVLWSKLTALAPIFAGYIIGFALLAVYWTSHHFLLSIFAKNTDRVLANWNILFLVFVSLVPFTSHLIGRYPETQLAIFIFALNVITIGSVLYQIRRYVYHSKTIENGELTKKDIRNSSLRILVPTVFAIIAVPVSFYHVQTALWLFIVPVVFNLIPGSFNFIDMILIKLGLEKPLEEINKNLLD